MRRAARASLTRPYTVTPAGTTTDPFTVMAASNFVVKRAPA